MTSATGAVAASWPLPALGAWAFAWALHLVLAPLAGGLAAGTAATAAGLAAAPLLAGTPWRRAIVALGFPLSLVAAGAAGTASAWFWLLPLAALALVYPMGAWRDAPLFPTPRGALDGLAAALPLADGARVLDAGCGTGDALLELHREYPRAALLGVEQSAPVALAARWRLGRRATVARGDLWSGDWSGIALVYVFQRPESMPRIAAKAVHEMRPDAFLATLEFPVVGATTVFTGSGERTLFVYRVVDLGDAVSPPPAPRT